MGLLEKEAKRRLNSRSSTEDDEENKEIPPINEDIDKTWKHNRNNYILKLKRSNVKNPNSNMLSKYKIKYDEKKKNIHINNYYLIVFFENYHYFC